MDGKRDEAIFRHACRLSASRHAMVDQLTIKGVPLRWPCSTRERAHAIGALGSPGRAFAVSARPLLSQPRPFYGMHLAVQIDISQAGYLRLDFTAPVTRSRYRARRQLTNILCCLSYLVSNICCRDASLSGLRTVRTFNCYGFGPRPTIPHLRVLTGRG